MARDRCGALLVVPAPFLTGQASRITGLAAQVPVAGSLHYPGIPGDRGLDELRSEEQKNLPAGRAPGRQDPQGRETGRHSLQQPTEFELTVNTKVAKALGRIFPQSLLVRATNVTE